MQPDDGIRIALHIHLENRNLFEFVGLIGPHLGP
jgi:hypothetical protein